MANTKNEQRYNRAKITLSYSKKYMEEIEWHYIRRNSTIDEVQQFKGQNSNTPEI